MAIGYPSFLIYQPDANLAYILQCVLTLTSVPSQFIVAAFANLKQRRSSYNTQLCMIELSAT
jgi:hypothetical protein